MGSWVLINESWYKVFSKLFIKMFESQCRTVLDNLGSLIANVFTVNLPAGNEQHKGAIEKAVLRIRPRSIVNIPKNFCNLNYFPPLSAVEYVERVTGQC